MSAALDRSSTLRLLRAASGELDRAMRRMRIPGHPRPYYLSYLVRDEELWRIQARYGALIQDTHERKRSAYVDVRVGSWRSDHVREGGLEDNDREAESYGYVELPFGRDLDGLRHGLWRLTDARYREAVDSLLQKRAHEVTYRNTHDHLRAFQRMAPRVDLAWEPLPQVDRERWARYVETTSKRLRRHVEVKDSHVEFQAEHVCRVFLDSSGSRLVQCQPIWSLEAYLWLLSDGGDAFPWTHKRTVTDPAELPDEATFLGEIRQVVAHLRRLAAAPSLRSYCGPALLEPVPAGLLIHEAVGHRLEGTRLLASGEGQTFRGAVGQRILPSFLSIRDDPTLARFDGRSLVGHYRYDDEGAPAAPAHLVRRGRLTGYLTSRTGIVPRHRTNGHARCAYHERPISRMAVLVVEADEGLGDAELKAALVKEIRRQKVPYGMRIVHATSGETATDAYNFQAFLGEINLAHKVFPDGREECVRGVNFVGTPLNAIRGILAAGRRLEIDNAFCGAESGYVPVSTISPALLVSELELQSKPEMRYTPYTFPMPWAE